MPQSGTQCYKIGTMFKRIEKAVNFTTGFFHHFALSNWESNFPPHVYFMVNPGSDDINWTNRVITPQLPLNLQDLDLILDDYEAEAFAKYDAYLAAKGWKYTDGAYLYGDPTELLQTVIASMKPYCHCKATVYPNFANLNVKISGYKPEWFDSNGSHIITAPNPYTLSWTVDLHQPLAPSQLSKIVAELKAEAAKW